MEDPEHKTVRRIKNKTRITVLAAVILVFVLNVFFIGGWLIQYSLKKGPHGPESVIILIPPGASFEKIVRILAEGNLIHDDVRIKILAYLWGFSSKIRAGEFELQTGLKPKELLQKLTQAKSVQHRFTVAEGLNGREIALLLAQQGWCSEKDFLELIKNPMFIAEFDIGAPLSLEGYLYPDTYYLTRIPGLSTRDIASLMVNRFLQVWEEIGVDGKNVHETVILASIVEKETADPAERPRIASVFLNRLKTGMRLQSDPTVIYGIESFSGNLTRKDLQTPSPYNTYTEAGLPAGPICNPGREAIKAVLEPADENFLYFVSKNDGTHHFSKSLREHNRAVNKYQRKKKL